mmetsp:Transcript_1269/g.1626  ORF Transcript_1269/g.1626 Transcript_1269/m.1626 type:complete len:224 (+) Transcript_1269:1354-2025(+)
MRTQAPFFRVLTLVHKYVLCSGLVTLKKLSLVMDFLKINCVCGAIQPCLNYVNSPDIRLVSYTWHNHQMVKLLSLPPLMRPCDFGTSLHLHPQYLVVIKDHHNLVHLQLVLQHQPDHHPPVVVVVLVIIYQRVPLIWAARSRSAFDKSVSCFSIIFKLLLAQFFISFLHMFFFLIYLLFYPLLFITIYCIASLKLICTSTHLLFFNIKVCTSFFSPLSPMYLI